VCERGAEADPTSVQVLLECEPLRLNGAIAVSVRVPGGCDPAPATLFELNSVLGLVAC
jgi:hypothetical protein